MPKKASNIVTLGSMTLPTNPALPELVYVLHVKQTLNGVCYFQLQKHGSFRQCMLPMWLLPTIQQAMVQMRHNLLSQGHKVDTLPTPTVRTEQVQQAGPVMQFSPVQPVQQAVQQAPVQTVQPQQTMAQAVPLQQMDSTPSILHGNVAQFRAAVGAVTDLTELQSLYTAEQAGKARSSVLNDLSQRINRLAPVAAVTQAPAAVPAAVPADLAATIAAAVQAAMQQDREDRLNRAQALR